MLDLSFWEIIVIGVACILFLKPEDMPEMLRTAGKLFRKIKNTVNEFTSVLKLDDEDDTRILRPKSRILGLDGKYHPAYDVTEVFKDEMKETTPEKIEEKNE